MVIHYQDFISAVGTVTEFGTKNCNQQRCLEIATGEWNLDRANAARRGNDWHNNVLALVGSLVKKGLTDSEILLSAAGLTLPGYAVEQTYVEMQKMIDGARSKGFDSSNEGANISSKSLFDHVRDIELHPPQWLVKDMLIKHSLAALVGQSYSGKSYVAVDLACSVASGTAFNGQHVEQGGVYYIIGEGRFGIRRRVDAWCMDRGTQIDDRFNLHFSRHGLNLRDTASLQAIQKELRNAKDVSLIIVDTLARSFGGGNENAPQDMGEFIQACDDLMHEFSATVLIVHHTGKDSSAGARGHSSLFGALDTCMTLKKIGQYDILLHCEKQKDAPEFDDMQFCFVTLSGDDDTPVLHQVETMSRPKKLKLGVNEQLAMDTYMEATKGRPTQCRLHLDEWRTHFERRHTGDTLKKKMMPLAARAEP